ncbi:MAG: hypothetical protein WBH44_00890 [Proteocatella sp.]
MRRIVIALGISLLFLYIMFLSGAIVPSDTFIVSDFYISRAYMDTGAPNAVTSIYLFYRYYDTLFEALMLMMSIIGVIYMSVHEEDSGHDK